MEKVRPKKALGQHFLTDERIAQRIAQTVDIVPDIPIVEVGPGMGVLTKYLISTNRPLQVAEIDDESIQYLRRQFPSLDIIAGDFLQLPLDSIAPGSDICVIGNYPYNISSQIFFHILDYKDKVALCSGMLQREVAERITAPAGTKARGILSVLLQAWYDAEYLFTVSENVFNPPPKVKSGVISLRRNSVTDLGCDQRLFRTVVKTTFGQRRKTLRNSVRPLMPPATPFPDDPIFSLRPEQLSVDQFIYLTNLIDNLRQNGAQ
jgi:16S rRNA (adenine1518-N6/adenine1519-N6)-dimethyltransferase